MNRRSPRLGQRVADIPLVTRIVVYTVIVVALGIIGGLVWHGTTKVPSYTASDDGSVLMSQRAHGQVFSLDAMYSIIGLGAGLLVGYVTWFFFRRHGVIVSAIAVLGGTVAALICWAVGVFLGPRDVVVRIVEALPGDHVPVDFTIHTPVVIGCWILGAVTPIMLYSNLSPAYLVTTRRTRRAALDEEASDFEVIDDPDALDAEDVEILDERRPEAAAREA